MSIVIETLVFCDGKNRGFDCPQKGPYADGDARQERASVQRESAAREGWRTVSINDYCPTCAPKVRRVKAV